MHNPISDEVMTAIFAAISQFEKLKRKKEQLSSFWRKQRANNNHIKISKIRKWCRPPQK